MKLFIKIEVNKQWLLTKKTTFQEKKIYVTNVSDPLLLYDGNWSSNTFPMEPDK